MVAIRFELQRPLGHGAMAVVDLACDLELGRSVALKRLAENLARDDEVRARFLREARLAARLAHPNVVHVYDVGDDDGRPFLAMEYVDGETLAERAARRGPLPPDVPPSSASRRAAACTLPSTPPAWSHRDVKPHSLLLRADGVLKLGDFGIAIAVGGTRLTVAGTVLGTAAYLAPELARGEEATAAADLYGLGAVLYELLDRAPASRPVVDRGARGPAPIVPPAGAPRRWRRSSCAASRATRVATASAAARAGARATHLGADPGAARASVARATTILSRPRPTRRRGRRCSRARRGSRGAVAAGVARRRTRCAARRLRRHGRAGRRPSRTPPTRSSRLGTSLPGCAVLALTSCSTAAGAGSAGSSP